MADIVDKATRSRMMAGIKGKNTAPELVIRKGLHRLGFRYRLHNRSLPGRPDLVFPKHRAIILINGCFWHGHGCHLFKWPKSREEFWRAKIESNSLRDAKNQMLYEKLGWRVLVIWECALKGRYKIPDELLLDQAAGWLVSGGDYLELAGRSGINP